jgi:hypothetical protein
MKVNASDISISHRLGVRKEAEELTLDQEEEEEPKPRGIIVVLKSREHRLEILRARRKLKNTGISVHPDLTRPRAKLLRDASDKFDGRASVWADFNGRVWRSGYGKDAGKRIELFPDVFPGIWARDEVRPKPDGTQKKGRLQRK